MKPGSLARVDQFLANDAPSSVFTLHHWSSDPKDLKARPSGFNRYHRRRSRIDSGNNIYNNHARHVLIKIQESAVNFLVRWCLLDESYRLQQTNLKQVQHNGRRSHHPMNVRNKNLPQLIAKHQHELKYQNSHLLLRDVKRLRERNLTTFFRYLFWRWFTLVNVIELLLILLLGSCCVYQCYELLEDYYSYPTHVILSTVLNDNFRNDLPGVTICDNNRISSEALRRNYPDLNTTHFLAMSVGTFYSVNNFSLSMVPPKGLTHTQDWYGLDSSIPPNDLYSGKKYNQEQQQNASTINDSSSSTNITNDIQIIANSSETSAGETIGEQLDEDLINWVKVGRILSKFTPSGHFSVLPNQSIIDSLICATIGGERVPCDNLPELNSLQQASLCRTLFHDTVMWDKSLPSVRELERNLGERPQSIVFGKIGGVSVTSLYEFNEQIDCKEQHDEQNEEQANEGRLRAEMENMEIIRMRINFHSQDYANPRGLVGARLSIHSSSNIGEIGHLSYIIEPGNWYTYYIERSDHQRLPPPYSTQCYDYASNRYDWRHQSQELVKNFKHLHKLIVKQVNTTDRLLPEYVQYLKSRTMSRRDCFGVCQAQLSSVKCDCWNPTAPYYMTSSNLSIHVVDVNGTLNWCTLDSFREVQAREAEKGIKESAADDLFYQACAREYTALCLTACPDECDYSSFEVIQQSRSWPSHEAQRYNDDKRVWDRLRQEAECCATVSIIYTSPASTSLVTEPKYTRQDMVTIISGNIEAWLGVSAVHAYLVFERFHDALVEAQVIIPPAWVRGDSSSEQRGHQNWCSRSHYLHVFGNFAKLISDSIARACGPIGRFGATTATIVGSSLGALSGALISILTKLKLNLTQLFKYLSRKLLQSGAKV